MIMKQTKDVLSEMGQQYVHTVCEQIQCKSARKAVAWELTDHILCQKQDFMEQGMQDEEAEICAVLEMGEGKEVGMALDQIHRPKCQWQLMIPVFLLFGFGLVSRFLFSDIVEFESLFLLTGVGIGLFFLAYFLDVAVLYSMGKWFVLVVFLVLGLSFVLYHEHNGQPYFAMRYGMIPYYDFALILPIAQFAIYGLGYQRQKKGFLLCVVSIGLFFLYLLWCDHISYVLLYGVAAWSSLGVAVFCDWFGIGKKEGKRLFFVLTAIGMILLCLYLFFVLRYRFDMAVGRMTGEENDSGYVAALVQELWKNSQWLGMGEVPKGKWRTTILYVMHSKEFGAELFLAKVAFVKGKLFVFFILCAFVFLFCWSYHKIRNQKSSHAKITATCIWTILLFQTIGYIFYNFGFMILSMELLPLVSDGIVCFWLNAFLIGILLSVFRRENIANDGCILEKQIKNF